MIIISVEAKWAELYIFKFCMWHCDLNWPEAINFGTYLFRHEVFICLKYLYMWCSIIQ